MRPKRPQGGVEITVQLIAPVVVRPHVRVGQKFSLGAGHAGDSRLVAWLQSDRDRNPDRGAQGSGLARLGNAELAAYHVTVTLFFALALALDAVAIAGQALLGKSLGSGDVDGSRVITRRIVWWSVWLGVALALVILALRPFLPGWYGDDARIIALISSALLVLALLQPLSGVVFALDGVLIGAGDTRWLAWAQIAVLIAFLPAAWLVLAQDLGLDALWWALGWFLLVRAALLAWRARGSAWLVTGAVRPR